LFLPATQLRWLRVKAIAETYVDQYRCRSGDAHRPGSAIQFQGNGYVLNRGQGSEQPE